MRKCCLMLLLIAAVSSGTGTAAWAGGVQWRSFENGCEQGRRENKISYVFFRADWCAACHQMEKETFQHRRVIDTLTGHFVAIKIDADKRRPLAEKYGADKLPHSVFLSVDGEVIAHRPAYIPPPLFLKILQALIASEQAGSGGP